MAIDGPPARWTPTDYLLADIYDALMLANWQRANEGSKSPGKRPEPYPRPVRERQRGVVITDEALLDHRRRMAERERQLQAAA